MKSTSAAAAAVELQKRVPKSAADPKRAGAVPGHSSTAQPPTRSLVHVNKKLDMRKQTSSGGDGSGHALSKDKREITTPARKADGENGNSGGETTQVELEQSAAAEAQDEHRTPT